MDIFGVLALLGGLAIFLYGMDLLGEGLTGASGGKLENILEKLNSYKLLFIRTSCPSKKCFNS
jgi:phosphate:Na+ symporter